MADKGKIPHSSVCEYDPHMQAAEGKPREKHMRGTNYTMAGRPGLATSPKPKAMRSKEGKTQRY